MSLIAILMNGPYVVEGETVCAGSTRASRVAIPSLVQTAAGSDSFPETVCHVANHERCASSGYEPLGEQARLTTS